MNRFIFSLLFFVSSTLQSAPVEKIGFSNSYDIRDFSGQSYLSFMKETIKPAMDTLATEGYVMRDGEAIEKAFNLVDRSVQRKISRAGKSLDNIKRIADELAGEIVTLETLPGRIAEIDRSVNRYKLATFLGLASGGGIEIMYFEQNYGLNVHYDTVEERSGRSFGVGPTRMANDASDKNYLKDLEKYLSESSEDSEDFYQTIFEVILNSDSSHYAQVEDEGQTVLTDFLSVYTAEQARNLMDGRVHPHWDAALLEVTLLAAFHAGQEEIKLFYQNPETKETSFTSETFAQTPCEFSDRKQKAGLKDYWQFSRNINSSEHCRRSGINITKREFRRLGSELTTYVKENNRELYNEVIAAMGMRSSRNFFQSLSSRLITLKAPAKYSLTKLNAYVGAWVELLKYVKDHAPAITAQLEESSESR